MMLTRDPSHPVAMSPPREQTTEVPKKPCERCKGEGWLEPIGPCADDSYITSRPCPNCRGTGESWSTSRAAGTIDAFLETLPDVGESQWPNRLLMEIECINDPVELEAVKQLIDERIAWLRG